MWLLTPTLDQFLVLFQSWETYNMANFRIKQTSKINKGNPWKIINRETRKICWEHKSTHQWEAQNSGNIYAHLSQNRHQTMLWHHKIFIVLIVLVKQPDLGYYSHYLYSNTDEYRFQNIHIHIWILTKKNLYIRIWLLAEACSIPEYFPLFVPKWSLQ